MQGHSNARWAYGGEKYSQVFSDKTGLTGAYFQVRSNAFYNDGSAAQFTADYVGNAFLYKQIGGLWQRVSVSPTQSGSIAATTSGDYILSSSGVNTSPYLTGYTTSYGNSNAYSQSFALYNNTYIPKDRNIYSIGTDRRGSFWSVSGTQSNGLNFYSRDYGTFRGCAVNGGLPTQTIGTGRDSSISSVGDFSGGISAALGSTQGPYGVYIYYYSAAYTFTKRAQIPSSSAVRAVKFSDDSTTLIFSQDTSPYVRVFAHNLSDNSYNEIVAPFDNPPDFPANIALSANGDILALSSMYTPIVKTYRRIDGVYVEMDSVEANFYGVVGDIDLSPSGIWLGTCEGYSDNSAQTEIKILKLES